MRFHTSSFSKLSYFAHYDFRFEWLPPAHSPILSLVHAQLARSLSQSYYGLYSIVPTARADSTAPRLPKNRLEDPQGILHLGKRHDQFSPSPQHHSGPTIQPPPRRATPSKLSPMIPTCTPLRNTPRLTDRCLPTPRRRCICLQLRIYWSLRLKKTLVQAPVNS